MIDLQFEKILISLFVLILLFFLSLSIIIKTWLHSQDSNILQFISIISVVFIFFFIIYNNNTNIFQTKSYLNSIKVTDQVAGKAILEIQNTNLFPQKWVIEKDDENVVTIIRNSNQTKIRINNNENYNIEVYEGNTNLLLAKENISLKKNVK